MAVYGVAGQIATSTTAVVQVLPALSARDFVELTNLGSANVLISPSSLVTSTSGYPLLPNTPFRLVGAGAGDAISAIAASSTPTIAYYSR